MTSIAAPDHALGHVTPSRRAARWAPLVGIGFVIFFLVSVAASSPPAESASDAKWIADYTGHSHRVGHLTTGVCLVLAGLCFVSFMTVVWTRIVDASPDVRRSPLPVLAAAVTAACMAVGGVLMGGAVTVIHTGVTPDANLLRFANSIGFAMVGIGAMLAASLSVATASLQARSAGLFGPKLTAFGVVVAVILLASIAFIPIVGLLIWLVAITVTLLRAPTTA